MQVKYQTFYHLYNHAISNENLFRTEDNYSFFIEKYELYLHPIAITYAFCLMPNHFHFLIKFKTEEEIKGYFFPDKDLAGSENLQGFLQTKINKQFSNFFNSYAKAFNKVYERQGKLFRNSMKLKEVTDDDYLRKLIHYIHYNPVLHGFTDDPADWRYSSYQGINGNKKSMLVLNEIMELFVDETEFKKYHKNHVDEKLLNELEF